MAYKLAHELGELDVDVLLASISIGKLNEWADYFGWIENLSPDVSENAPSSTDKMSSLAMQTILQARYG